MEIAPGVYSLVQFKGAYVHAFLLDTGDELILIDTLFDTDARLILDLIKRIGRKVTDVRHLVMTHAHKSHLGGLKLLKEMSGAPVYAHEWEVGIINGQRKATRVTLRPMRPFRTYPWQLGLAAGLDKHPFVQVDRTIADGDCIGPIQVIHTPGHTPGHLAFYWPALKVLFTGDAVVTWPEPQAGWPGFMLDFEQQKVSVRRMAALDVQVLAVGHGDPIVSGGGKILRELADEIGAGSLERP